jgi:hypothetical protein
MSQPAIPPVPVVNIPAEATGRATGPRAAVRAALADAATLLTEHGWVRGEWQTFDNHFCLAGAINRTIAGQPEVPIHVSALPELTQLLLIRTKGALARRICAVTGWAINVYDSWITRWNDSECTDGAQALAMLLSVTDADIDAAIDAHPGPGQEPRAEPSDAPATWTTQVALYNSTFPTISDTTMKWFVEAPLIDPVQALNFAAPFDLTFA